MLYMYCPIQLVNGKQQMVTLSCRLERLDITVVHSQLLTHVFTIYVRETFTLMKWVGLRSII